MFTRADLAARFARRVAEGRPNYFVGEICHQVGLCDKEGRTHYTAAGMPTLAKDRKIDPQSFDLHMLTEAMLGPDWRERLSLGRSGGNASFGDYLRKCVRESAAAPVGPSPFLNTSAWSSAVGGLLQAAVLQSYETAEFQIRSLFPTENARIWEGEKLIDIIGPYEAAAEIGPGEPHVDQPMGELFVQAGRVRKYGAKITLTKEAAWADITGGLIMARAKNLGYTLAYRENELAIDVLIGVTNNFRLGTSKDENAVGYNTYGATIGGSPLGNDLVNPLQDLTSLIRTRNAFGRMRHPVSGLVLAQTKPTSMVVPYTLEDFANGILGATRITMGNQPGAPFPAPAGLFPTGVTEMDNPFKNYVKVISDQWLYARHVAPVAATGLNTPGSGLGLSDADALRYYTGDPAKFARRRVAWEANVIDLNPTDFALADLGIVAGQVGDIAVQYQVTSPYAMVRNKVS